MTRKQITTKYSIIYNYISNTVKKCNQAVFLKKNDQGEGYDTQIPPP